MILFAGRIDPGSGAVVFTGQRVSLRPALIAATSAMLSFLSRPGTDGTSTFGARDVSAGALDEVVPEAATGVTAGVEDARDVIRGCPAASAGSRAVVGFFSLAAHATSVTAENIAAPVAAMRRRNGRIFIFSLGCSIKGRIWAPRRSSLSDGTGSVETYHNSCQNRCLPEYGMHTFSIRNRRCAPLGCF